VRTPVHMRVQPDSRWRTCGQGNRRNRARHREGTRGTRLHPRRTGDPAQAHGRLPQGPCEGIRVVARGPLRADRRGRPGRGAGGHQDRALTARVLRTSMAYVLLFFAIIAEVAGTSLLKSTEGFSRLWPTVACLVAYFAAFFLLAVAVERGMNVG